MNAVLLVSEKDYIISAMKRSLPEGSTAVCLSSAEDLPAYTAMDVDAALVDLTSMRSEHTGLLIQIGKLLPHCGIVAMLPAESREGDEDILSLAYETLRLPIDISALRASLARCLERGRLFREVSRLQTGTDNLPVQEVPSGAGERLDARFSGVLRKFARGLGTGYDRRKLVMFINEAIDELNPVSRVSIILAVPGGGYALESSRGLNPGIIEGIHLSTDRGLLLWLTQQGRVLRRTEAMQSRDRLLADAAREMDVLQAVISIPIVGKGKLLGAINLGDKALGGCYSNEELEMLYILASNIAVSLENITIFNELQQQKAYMEDILLRMNSGVITIGSDDRIAIFNSRAASILGVSREDVVGNDLRCLPSPLGDMLYESVMSDRKRHREEVILSGERNCHLQVSTLQLCNSEGIAWGAGLIFDDISAEAALASEKDYAQRLEMLNRVVALLAHELKNPLASVHTFIELFPDRKEDEEFNGSFYGTVRNDAGRLNDMLDKLIALSQQSEYEFEEANLADIIRKRLAALEKIAVAAGVTVSLEQCDLLVSVRADRKQLGRAIEYIIRNSIDASVSGGKVGIKLDTDSEKGGVCMIVADGGKPFPDDFVADVFRPFFINDGRGSDIGLAVAHKIICDHGGRIDFNFEGSSGFSVVLPLLSDDRRRSLIIGEPGAVAQGRIPLGGRQ